MGIIFEILVGFVVSFWEGKIVGAVICVLIDIVLGIVVYIVLEILIGFELGNILWITLNMFFFKFLIIYKNEKL